MANMSICHKGKPLLDLLRLKNVLTMTIYVECGPKASLISLWSTILRRPLTWLLMWRPNLAMPLTSTRQLWGANHGDVKSHHEFQSFWGPKCGTSPTILRSNSWQLGYASQMRATLCPKVPNYSNLLMRTGGRIASTQMKLVCRNLPSLASRVSLIFFGARLAN